MRVFLKIDYKICNLYTRRLIYGSEVADYPVEWEIKKIKNKLHKHKGANPWS